MTQTGSNISDTRLLSILRGGELLRYAVDPEGVLCDWKVSVLDVCMVDGLLNWTAVFVTDRSSLTVSGYFEGKEAFVSSVKTDGYESDKSVKAQNSVLQALGNLSGLPPKFKAVLSPVGLEILNFDKPAAFLDAAFFHNETEALFWGVDGGKGEDGYRKYFTSYRTRYSVDREGKGKVELSSAYSFENSRIVVKTDVDVFGLGNKKVYLEKNLGLGRFVKCECTRQIDGRAVPSLAVAFDMSDAVPVLYCKERKAKIKMKLPKG